MDETVGAALILLVIFGSIATIILGSIYLKNRNKERMTILAQGADPNLFKDDFKLSRNISMKFAVLFISIAVGILIGYIVESNFFIPEGVAYFSAIFMCGGLGLLIGSVIDKKDEKK
jgi:hypothetical protein